MYQKLISYLRLYYTDIKKHFVLFVLIFIIINGLLIFINIKKANTYTSSFTVIYEDLVRKVYGDRLNKLDELLKTNPKKAQSLLHLDKKVIASINEINATNILGEDLSQDLNVDKIPFIVNVRTKDTNYIHKIQSSIIHYLENSNKYLVEKRRLRNEEIEGELAFIDEQLNLMDSLKRKFNFSQPTPSTNTDASGSSVYEVSYELYKKRQELVKKKQMPMNLYVIDDAIVPVKSSKPFMLVIAIGIIASILVYSLVVYLVLPVIRK